MRRINELQAARNAEVRDAWDRFVPHRRRVTQLLVKAVQTAESKLCVLGAGNCNDLDLERLTGSFMHVDLVDIDGAALEEGLARQNISADRVTLHGGVDVTGVAGVLSDWVPDVPVPDEQVLACISDVQEAALPLKERTYSVAASVCLLSQLIEFTTLTLGASHDRFLDLLKCLRHEHLRQLTELAKPGGTVVLVTDVVSSITVPELATVSESELPMVVGRAIADRNFFTGVNPLVLKQLLETDEDLAAKLTDIRLSHPWVWDLGPRLYAVCALTARRV